MTTPNELAAMPGVKVRALTWRGSGTIWTKADAEFGGGYLIRVYSGMTKPFRLETLGWWSGEGGGHYASLDEAKAAAQADYEARIRSALEPAPAPGMEPRGCPTPGACSCPAPAPETAGEALDYCSARWHLENWPDTATKEHIQAVRKTIETLTAALAAEKQQTEAFREKLADALGRLKVAQDTLAAANKRADAAERIVADVNNSVFGSQGFFATPSCVAEVEKIKHLCHEYRLRAEQAEARVAALVEALGLIDALDPESRIDGCSPDALRGLIIRMGAIARHALATSKQSGGGDE